MTKERTDQSEKEGVPYNPRPRQPLSELLKAIPPGSNDSIDAEVSVAQVKSTDSTSALETTSDLSATSKALSSLPQEEQRKLNAISQELVDTVSSGPSSLIDQDVLALLTRLPQESQLKFWDYVLSPIQSFKMLGAQGKERETKAKLRSSVAQSGLSLAKLAEEDLERKVWDIFLNNLQRTMGPNMEIYCQERGLELPAKGTSAEKAMLVRMHSEELAMAKYREERQAEIMKFVHKRVELESKISWSNQHAQMLPGLIESRKHEFPLMQKLWVQKVGFGTSMAAGTFGAAVSGIVVGVVSGLYYGSEEALEEAKNRAAEKMEEIKASAAERMSAIKDGISARFGKK